MKIEIFTGIALVFICINIHLIMDSALTESIKL